MEYEYPDTRVQYPGPGSRISGYPYPGTRTHGHTCGVWSVLIFVIDENTDDVMLIFLSS